MAADPGADHRLPALAARASLSERHLRRLVVEQTGTTPGRIVER
ncbi:MAG: AraC family transcriptional regulator, partial [Solirubrobacterales bacterium]|nr:AraC family transcriptional regulator [Solirubrobacterales bacterium]